jgi:hypothetical protein
VQNSKDILIDLIKGSISNDLLSKIKAERPLTPQEQEQLHAAIMTISDAKYAPFLTDDSLTPQQLKELKVVDRWRKALYDPAFKYAEKMKWFEVPFKRIEKEIDDSTPVVTAVPFTYTGFAYHATNFKFLDRIKKIGLTPRDPADDTGLPGNRAIFFYGTYKEAAWLADGLLEDGAWEKAAILKVDISGLPLYKRSTGSHVGGEEFYTGYRVLPNRIIEASVYPLNFRDYTKTI